MSVTVPQTSERSARLLAAIDAAHAGNGAPHPFSEQRKAARDAFADRGLPSKKVEEYKYTDLRKAIPAEMQFVDGPTDAFDASVLESVAIEGFDAARVVLVNGAFNEALSDLTPLPNGVVACSLRKALTEHVSLVSEHFGQIADLDEPLAALNAAFDLDGLFLHVPDGLEVETPLHVIHVLDSRKPAIVQSRHLHIFGDNTSFRFVETMYATESSGESFGNHMTEVAVGSGACINLIRVQDEGTRANQVNTLVARQEKDSNLSTLTFTFAAGIVRNNIISNIGGSGCDSNVSGLYILHDAEHVDTHTLLNHQAPACESNELYKGIVYDRATGVFNGKVFVDQVAQQTNAYQQSQGVVLSPDADFYAKPELEIYADDVKCSHGSTTGAVEPEHIFYLRSRGVSEVDARAMLLYAFAIDITEMVEIEPVRHYLDRRIAELLK